MSKLRGAPSPTRKHVARAEREARQRLWISIGTMITALAVVGLVAAGIIQSRVIEPKQPVAIVGGREITTRDFQARINLVQFRLGGGQDPEQIGNLVLEQLIEEELLRTQVAEMGISVSEQEFEKAFRESFGYFPDGSPTPGPTATANATVDSALTSTAAAAPSATATEAPTEGPSPTVDPSATTAATPTPFPSATAFTEEGFQVFRQDFFDQLEDFGITEQDFRQELEARLLQEKVMETFEDDVSREIEEVQARHILVDEEDVAADLLQQLQDGADFAELAMEFSEDGSAEEGGDLGYFTFDMMVEPFAEAAFAADVGELVGPVQTSFGYHVIEVLDHRERLMDDNEFQQAVFTEFRQWLTSVRMESDVEIVDDWMERLPDPLPSFFGGA